MRLVLKTLPRSAQSSRLSRTSKYCSHSPSGTAGSPRFPPHTTAARTWPAGSRPAGCSWAGQTPRTKRTCGAQQASKKGRAWLGGTSCLQLFSKVGGSAVLGAREQKARAAAGVLPSRRRRWPSRFARCQKALPCTRAPARGPTPAGRGPRQGMPRVPMQGLGTRPRQLAAHQPPRQILNIKYQRRAITGLTRRSRRRRSAPGLASRQPAPSRCARTPPARSGRAGCTSCTAAHGAQWGRRKQGGGCPQ